MGTAESKSPGHPGCNDSDNMCCKFRAEDLVSRKIPHQEIAPLKAPPLHTAVIMDESSRVTQMLSTGLINADQTDAYGYTGIRYQSDSMVLVRA